ncbi:hypothetical protein [Shinella sp.]|uniref:hypothetical protein n=1 Tax=Shinella sp. TaxID=1870904 RepID=UPI00403750A4
MLRSAFARRFSTAVRLAPVEYLLRWRMALAKDALRQRQGSLEEIAEGSAIAFCKRLQHGLQPQGGLPARRIRARPDGIVFSARTSAGC